MVFTWLYWKEKNKNNSEMKKIYSFVLLFNFVLGFAQAGAPASPYYDGFNWTQTGMTLKASLATKLTTTHTKFLTYAQVWNASQITDLDPTDITNTYVELIYGFSNGTCPIADPADDDHRTRNKAFNGGNQTCEWNREHVYAKSLGTPPLIDGATTIADSDAGEDAHHLRAADVDRNANRGNELFTTGSGNSHDVTTTTWYPGDEWKGDVARMMMYMYLRYPTQCLPINVGTGTTVSNDSNMINLFLQWNAEDPVNQYEDNRNTYHGNTINTYAQGNRNPFIDNPYLATVIWGGPVAENRWPTVFLSVPNFDLASTISVYPNPTNDNKINIESEINLDNIELINVNGQIIQQIKNPKALNKVYTLENLPKGFYLLKFSSENTSTTKKIIIN